ncbi:hypothetical protein EBS57_08660, partial [bacterium]|nr:hypothetical protein [bacterium]
MHIEQLQWWQYDIHKFVWAGLCGHIHQCGKHIDLLCWEQWRQIPPEQFRQFGYNFVVKGNISSTTAGSVRGLNKTGAGVLEMRGANNSYNGDTTIYNGTLSVTNGANLNGTSVRVAPSSGNSGTLLVNGTAGAVVVSARGILAGGGTVGNVTLESGSFLNPGNSPGTLTAASSRWGAGSTYNWEINQATGGTAGVNWDLFSVFGALDLSALSSSAQMNLVLNSLP